MKLAGAMLVVIALGTGSATAMAESDPGWFAGHSTEERHALVDYAYVRTAQATLEAATAGQALADDVAAAATDELPLAGELGAEEFATLESAGLMAEVSALAPALALGAGVLAAGVAIEPMRHCGCSSSTRSLRAWSAPGSTRFSDAPHTRTRARR